MEADLIPPVMYFSNENKILYRMEIEYAEDF